MKREKNSSGRLVVELSLLLPMLITLILVSSELARFIRCKQAAVVLTNEIGKAAYRACGHLYQDGLDTNGGVVAGFNLNLTTQRVNLCLTDLMNRGGSNTGFSKLENDVATYLHLEGTNSVRTRVSIYDSTGTPPTRTLIGKYPAADAFPITSANDLVDRHNFFLNSQAPAIAPRRSVVVEVWFRVSGMMSFSRAVGLSRIPANGWGYEAAIL